MTRQASYLGYLGAALLFAACNSFNQAEHQLDHPSGKVGDQAAVQKAVQQGHTQDVSIGVADSTTGAVPVPFAADLRASGFLALLDRAGLPPAELGLIKNLTALAFSRVPYSLHTDQQG